MADVAEIWRHPIKSHGREALQSVALTEGKTLPWDRHWAVTHAASKFDPDSPDWVMCRNFMIGMSTPALAGIWATLDENTGTLTLTHANLDPLTFRPDQAEDVAQFLDWVAPLCPAEGRQPTGLVSAGERGMTDTDIPTISLLNIASSDAVADQLQTTVERERWRGNIWLSGLVPWAEFDLVGRDVKIGEAILHVIEPIERCMATTANPISGIRDVDTLKGLRDGWGHEDFGVYATVKQSGTLRVGDRLEVI